MRRLLPSTVLLARKRMLMLPLDLIDAFTSLPFREARRLPANRLRIRVGVGHRILFNQIYFVKQGMGFWLQAFNDGIVQLDSEIVDIGCGCGRVAQHLNRRSFSGRYIGLDIDAEAIDWCQKNFPKDRFRFEVLDKFSSLYNPKGRTGQVRFPCESASQDLVFSTSLITHLLEDDVECYLQESHRILRKGGWMRMTVLSIDHMQLKSDGYHTMGHRVGQAYVESPKYPEAAVAYSNEFFLGLCRRIGFKDTSIVPETQSVLTASK